MPAKGGGGHTWELVYESFNIPQQFHTYSRVTCKVWRYSDALIKLSVYPIYKPLPRGPGSSTSLARCLQEQKGLLQGEDLEQEQDTDEPVKKRGGCGAQQPNIIVDGMKMVAEFKTTNKKTYEQGEMCPTLCFSMYICAKQAQMETRSPLVQPGTEKAIGVDLLVPLIVYPPRYSLDGGSQVDICLGLCLVRS